MLSLANKLSYTDMQLVLAHLYIQSEYEIHAISNV